MKKSSQKDLAAAYARRAKRLAKKALLDPRKKVSDQLARQSKLMSAKGTSLYLCARG